MYVVAAAEEARRVVSARVARVSARMAVEGAAELVVQMSAASLLRVLVSSRADSIGTELSPPASSGWLIGHKPVCGRALIK